MHNYLMITLKIVKVRWLITTSYLISKIQISGRTSETLERGFELLAEDLNIRPMVRVCI